MEIRSRLMDHKINALNVLMEIELLEYVGIAEEILNNNSFQRKRVKSSSTVYSLLKKDLKERCIIPPIVLALSVNVPEDGLSSLSDEKIKGIIKTNFASLLILDGLQRTYTLLELRNELVHDLGEEKAREELARRPLRIEFYLGINKIGILYRMLTLNTGQTPMSLRHQIEVLYSDYLENPPAGIRFITEAEGDAIRKQGEYKFQDAIVGFDSYLERDELPLDRTDILDNIKSLKKLSKENTKSDLFINFISTYDAFVKKINSQVPDFAFDDEAVQHSMSGPPFGTTMLRIFSKSQSLTGFGSAIGKLIDFEGTSSFEEVLELINTSDKIIVTSESINNLIINIDKIRIKSRKIGNDQRLFFHFLYRELFDKKGDAFLDFDESVKEAYKAFERKTL
jgi:hypothetical protein